MVVAVLVEAMLPSESDLPESEDVPPVGEKEEDYFSIRK